MNTQTEVTPTNIQLEVTDRQFKIDWFKAFVRTEEPDLIHRCAQLLQVEAPLIARDVVLGQKYWHEHYGIPGMSLMVNRPVYPVREHLYCVELTGRFLTGNILQVLELAHLLNDSGELDMRRIDLACDFYPYQGLALKPWEAYVQNRKVSGYQKVQRIVRSDHSGVRSTLDLGSRSSEQMVRFYCKEIDAVLCDRWEVEFKRSKAQQVIENFLESGPRCLFDYLFGSVVLLGEDWFDNYRLCEGVRLSSKVSQTSIERSLNFLWSIAPSLAMLHECFGDEYFFNLVHRVVASGKLKLKSRHINAIAEYQNYQGVA